MVSPKLKYPLVAGTYTVKTIVAAVTNAVDNASLAVFKPKYEVDSILFYLGSESNI